MLLIQNPHTARHRKRRAFWAVVLSLASHVAILGLIVFLSLLKLNLPENKLRSANPVSLRPLSNAQFDNARRVRGNDSSEANRTAKRQEPKKDEPKKDKFEKGQVVDVQKGNGKVDENAKYLAESSNQVKKQTHAKKQTPFYKNAAPQETAQKKREGQGQDDVEVAQKAGNGGAGQDDRPKMTEMLRQRSLEIPEIKKKSAIALKSDNSAGPGLEVENQEEAEAMRGNSKRLLIRPGQEQGIEGSDGRAGSAGLMNLFPSAAEVGKIAGAAPNDHLKDVDEGDATYLNTREWKYASYFNRLKQSVTQNWNPAQSMRVRDPSGTIYSGRDRYTVLTVTLDNEGRLKDCFVEKSSGLDFLDLEAVRSFERAQPFPHPPPQLLQADASIRFQFGFYLEMGQPGLQLFRSN